MAPPARTHPRLEVEAGFSLIELLVGMTIAMVVFFAAVNFIGVGERTQASTGERADALGQQRAGLERITRELRQAHTAWPSGDVLEFIRPAADPATDLRVRYDCSTGGECRRSETPDGQAFPSTSQPVVRDVQSAAFALSGDYVSIDLRVALRDREMPIVLQDGVHLRNEPEA